MPNIKPEDFGNYIESLLGKYQAEVIDKKSKEIVDRLGKEAKPEIKSYSVKNVQLWRTGEYQKGWVLRSTRKQGIAQVKLYNKAKPTLVHLLEFGHGGPMPARAYPHVSKTELKYMRLLYEELRRELQ